MIGLILLEDVIRGIRDGDKIAMPCHAMRCDVMRCFYDIYDWIGQIAGCGKLGFGNRLMDMDDGWMDILHGRSERAD